MTRQTRVGLVLGLFFIVAFGLILSELQTLGTPQDAVDSVASPIETDYNHATPAPSVGPIVDPGVTHRSVPARPEYTRRDPRGGGIERIVIPRPDWTEDMVGATAREHRSEPIPDRRELVPAPRHDVTPAPPVSTARTYTVRQGDSLSRIAAQQYGPGGAEHYLRIYEANRDILDSADSLVVGQTLRIPPLTASTPEPARPAERASADRGSYREMTLDELDRSVGSRVLETRRPQTYVVRSGDNLTRIARRVLRDTSPEAVDRLFEANRDQLRSPNHLVEGMTLKLPS